MRPVYAIRRNKNSYEIYRVETGKAVETFKWGKTESDRAMGKASATRHDLNEAARKETP